MNEMNDNQVNQEELLQEEPVLQEDNVYTPRPRWQRIGAAVLAAIMILGVIGYYYWIMYRY
jgi:hypothetical protein